MADGRCSIFDVRMDAIIFSVYEYDRKFDLTIKATLQPTAKNKIRYQSHVFSHPFNECNTSSDEKKYRMIFRV